MVCGTGHGREGGVEEPLQHPAVAVCGARRCSTRVSERTVRGNPGGAGFLWGGRFSTWYAVLPSSMVWRCTL